MTWKSMGKMKKTIKRIFAIVMAMCVIFAYSGAAMAKNSVDKQQQNFGTGQTMVHLHGLGGLCENKKTVEVKVGEKTYTATLNGSTLSFDMGTDANTLTPGTKIPYKVLTGKNAGETGIINNGTPCQDTKLNFYHEPFFANYV